MHPRLEYIDRRISAWMDHMGHPLHRVSLGLFFVWVGLLKLFGHTTGSSLLAHTIYWGSPELTVPLLGAWEVVIGATLLFPTTVRVSVLLIAFRVPGTLLALVLMSDVCFRVVPWIPTLEGQYLVKDLMLLGAAMLVGGSVRHRRHHRVHVPGRLAQ